MPTPIFGLPYPKTQRGDAEQTWITDSWKHSILSEPIHLIEYIGNTFGATQTELFIKGKGPVSNQKGGTIADSAHRLYVPEDSYGAFEFSYVGYNLSSIPIVAGSVVVAGTGTIAVVRPDAGNVTLATAASGTPPAGTTIVANPSYILSVGNAAANPVVVDADTATQSIRVRVTGTAASRILWRVLFRPLFTISKRTLPVYGDTGTGDSLEP